MKTNKAKVIQTPKEFEKSKEQKEYEKKFTMKKLQIEIKCAERAVAFKQMQLDTGNILETQDGFEGKKPEFILRNEIDINNFQIDQKKEQLEQLLLAEKEDADNSKH